METIRSKTVQRAAVVRPAAAPAPAARRVQASSLRVSSPSDPAEKEADATAKQVVRMAVPESSVALVPTPTGGVFRRTLKEEEKDRLPRRKMESPYVARFAGALRRKEEPVQRKGEGEPNVAANVAAEIQASTGSGSPLPLSVRRFMEPRFRADFSGVRVHTGDKSARLNRQLNARAFAVGNQVFFGRGHFQPETTAGKELIAHELTHTVQQGAAPRQVQRSEDVAITQQAPEQVQRLGIGDALNHFANAANAIPGFRMFTIILGVNPINMSRVERSAANILRAMVEFIPGGALIVAALDNYGIFDRAGSWVEQQIRALGMTGSLIRDAINRFLDSLSWTDIFDLGGVWERAKAIFTEPIGRIIATAKSIGTGIINFVKDAVVRPLAGLAEGTRGYDLLKAVMGKDPITGDPFPRNADTLIGGFMKLIGQEEVWGNLKKANAVARAWAWFQGAMAALMGFVEAIPATFMSAVKSLEIADLVLLPRAFAKVAKVFGNFIGSFISWAGNAVWNLLEIVFDVVSPGAFGYIKKTGGALRSILRNPLPFVGNLVKAAKLGFSNFADRFGTHLKKGLIEWLTGSMPGIYIPKSFSLAEIVKFVFSVLGISWANIRAKLVRVVGETAVKAMETGFDIVVTLVTQGPAAAWDKIKDQLGNLKDMVIGGITDFVVDAVTKKAVPKLLALFVPGAGFISAILTIYDTVMVFVNKISKIAQVVSGFINSIVAIASGAIGAAATRVENTLAGLLSLAISFLAGFAGLGNVSAKLMGIINTRVRAPIDKALDGIIAWIVAQAKKLGRYLAGPAPGPAGPDTRNDAEKRRDLTAAVAEANRIMRDEHPSEDKVLQRMEPLKRQFRLTRIEVVTDARDAQKVKYHLKLVINPDAPTVALVDPTRLNRIEVEPKFKMKKKGRGQRGEFDRQLGLQQETMNDMFVDVWLANRARWVSTGGARSLEGTKKQADTLEAERNAFRDRARAERTAAYKQRGLDDATATAEAFKFVNELLERYVTPTNRSRYVRAWHVDFFGTKVENEMYRKVALHALDQVAGGEGDDIRGVGGESEDKSLGIQWVKPDRIGKLQAKVEAQIKELGLKPANLKTVRMHVNLLPIEEVD